MRKGQDAVCVPKGKQSAVRGKMRGAVIFPTPVAIRKANAVQTVIVVRMGGQGIAGDILMIMAVWTLAVVLRAEHCITSSKLRGSMPIVNVVRQVERLQKKVWGVARPGYIVKCRGIRFCKKCKTKWGKATVLLPPSANQ